MSSDGGEQPPTARPAWRRPLAALRRERTRVLGALLALLAVATVVVWATRDRQPVDIVEVGFSPVRAVSGTHEGGSGVSWGAIVENTSDRAASGVVLRTTYHDAEGNIDDSYLHIVDVVLPDQRLGVGGHSVGINSSDLDGPAVDVEVTVDRVESWRSPDASAAITADDIWAGHSPDGELAVAFVARSHDDEPLDRIRARAVLRDDGGEIVGGFSGIITPLQPDQPTPAWITTPLEVPDATTVEVYVGRQ